MPLHLFRNRDFDLATIAGLATGVAMFGALAFLPTYLQMVEGVGATTAGLLMIPLMAARARSGAADYERSTSRRGGRIIGLPAHGPLSDPESTWR